MGIISHVADFNLRVGCFDTDIIPKCTKWFQLGVRRLIFGQLLEFQCASFSIRQMLKKYRMVETKRSSTWAMFVDKPPLVILAFGEDDALVRSEVGD